MGCPSCSKKAAAAQARINAASPVVFYRLIPGGVVDEWVFLDEQGREFKGPDKQLVISQIIQYRFENKLPEIPYLSELVETFTLLSSDNYANRREAYHPNNQVNQTARTIITGAAAYLKGLVSGVNFVSQEVAERRALVCMGCPFNQVVVNGSTKETPTLQQAKFCSMKGKKRVSTEGALFLCAKCTCINSCKVWFPKSTIHSASTQGLLNELNREIRMLNGQPGKCWIMDDKIE